MPDNPDKIWNQDDSVTDEELRSKGAEREPFPRHWGLEIFFGLQALVDFSIQLWFLCDV